MKSKYSKKRTLRNKRNRKSKKKYQKGGFNLKDFLKKPTDFKVQKLVHSIAQSKFDILETMIEIETISKRYNKSEDRYNGLYTSPIFKFNMKIPLSQLTRHGDIIIVFKTSLLENDHIGFLTESGGGKMRPDAIEYLNLKSNEYYGKAIYDMMNINIEKNENDHILLDGEIIINRNKNNDIVSIVSNVFSHIDYIIFNNVSDDIREYINSVIEDEATSKELKKVLKKSKFIDTKPDKTIIDLDNGSSTTV